MKTSLRLLLLAVFAVLFVGTASAHYNPQLGRWLSRDPLGEAGGFNLYAYCGNDPVNRHDPLGLADLYIGRNSDGEVILELSARIVNGMPQVHYWDWSHWWGAAIGGGTSDYWQTPSDSELARLFRQTPGGWRLASSSERNSTWDQQFDVTFQAAMHNAAETTAAVAKLHYGGLAFMTCPLILLEGGLTWGTFAAAAHEGYAGVSMLSGAVTGENYATSPEGWLVRQTRAPEWAEVGTDMLVNVGWRRKLFSVKAAEVRRKARWMGAC